MNQPLIFDLDGTLWDTSEVCAEAWNHAMAGRGFRTLTTSDLGGIMGLTREEVRLRFFAELDADEGRRLLQLCIDEEIRFLRRRPGTLYPGVADGLKRLAERHPLYLVSNCETEYLDLFFEGTGLGPQFLDSECHGRTNLGKAKNVGLVLERNRLTQGAYVGDTLGDQKAAEANRLEFWFAAYGFGTCTHADRSFPDFESLVSFCFLG
jgi:phosphoglycolate phosphatase